MPRCHDIVIRTDQPAPCHEREHDDVLVIAPDDVQPVDLKIISLKLPVNFGEGVLTIIASEMSTVTTRKAVLTTSDSLERSPNARMGSVPPM